MAENINPLLVSPENDTEETTKTYPTRITKIGEITCYFFSRYRNGKYPYWNIGPSRFFMYGMILFALFISCFFIITIQGSQMNWYIAGPCYLLVGYNIHLFQRTMLSNPGISEHIFDFYRSIEFKEDFNTIDFENLPKLTVEQI